VGNQSSLPTNAAFFGAELGIKFLFIDHEPLMPPLGNQVYAIMGFHCKDKLFSFDRDQFNANRDLQAGRRCRFMADIDVYSNGLLLRPIEVRIDCLDAGPFKKTNQETRGEDFRQVVYDIWLPRLREFQPEMIFISAGFDAHYEDDMGSLGLVESDYAWVTEQVKQVAGEFAQGRIVSLLEGGYALSALARSVVTHIKVLADL